MNQTLQSYDAIVIGAGMAGIPLAMKLAYKKMRTALVEAAEIGGTCLNRGCIPSKTLIASAGVAHKARHAEAWGVSSGPVTVDMRRVVARKDDLVRSIRSGSERNIERNPHLDLFRAWARFVEPTVVQVGDTRLTAKHIFVNTGTRNRKPSIEGLAEVPYLDSTSALELRSLPEHLVVVGGGYIGVEFAQMYRRFGSEVTLVQRQDQLLSQEDEDIAEALQEVLEREGIRVHTGAEAVRVEKRSEGVELEFLTSEGSEKVLGSHLLVATGRRANTDELGLEATSIDLDEQGFIKVGPGLETTQPGVWALGDVRGGAMFTHTARDDARILYENVVKGEALTTTDRVIPYAVFSDPQLGRVGLNEKQARAAGYDVKIGSYDGAKIAKARALGEAHGLITVVAEAESDRLLGASVLLSEGAEVVHELIAAVQAGVSHRDLGAALHIHPTLAEGVSSALGGVHRAASDAG